MNTTLENYLLVYNIVSGNLKPVNKLINKRELYDILLDYRFNSEVYALPYLFTVDKLVKNEVKFYVNGTYGFTVSVEVCENIDYEDVAKLMFNVETTEHFGYEKIVNLKGKLLLSGIITDFSHELIDNIPYSKVNTDDEVVFQSRNPPHRAHENIIEKYSPNLLYTTPFSTAKSTDYSFDTKIKCYEEISKIYGVNIFVSTLPRIFAGPREALQNCLLFQNLGAKYFIMGRGKNCVGDFYGDTESYNFCTKMKNQNKLKIDIIWEETQYVNNVEIKASKIKSEYVDKGLKPPLEFMSDYIYNIVKG